MNMAKLGTTCPNRVALSPFTPRGHPTRGGCKRMLGAPYPAPSVPEEPPTLPSPSLQVERRRTSGREQGEPWQEDRALPGGVLLSLRAEGSWCPAPPAGRDAAGILSTQLSSSLPWHRRAPSCQTGTRGGTHAHGVVSPAAALLLARIAARGSWAARSSPKQPRSGGCKVLPLLLELIPQQDTILRCPPSLSGDPQL